MNKSLDYILDYPKKWHIDPKSVDRNACEHFEVLYSYSYRELLKYYYASEINESLIKTHILDKLTWKILVDLWCGTYNCNPMAVAYLANAKAYMGIDVNVDLTDYGDEELKAYLREQYALSDVVQHHSTLIKTVFDNFDIFLKNAPDGAGYNFTINGLELTESVWTMRQHLQRLMLPGNIVIGNTTENIDLADVLVGPHKYTTILDVAGSDSLHIYEKLDNTLYPSNELVQEKITITLLDFYK